MPYDAFRYLIETSFHEDWELDGSTDNKVIESFIARDPHRVGEVSAEIRSYLESGPTPAKTSDWLESLGCAYDPAPSGLDANQWLARLASLLETRIA